jgi:inner membrane protein
MQGRTHLISGACAGAWLAVAVSPPIAVAVAGVAVAAVAAMTPDLDHLDATPSRSMELGRVRLGSRRLGSSRVLRVGPGPLISWTLRLVSRLTTGRSHRGITHSLVFAAVIGSLTGWVSTMAVSQSHAIYLGISAFLGVVAALAGDLVTRASLTHLLWPFATPVSIPKRLRIKTGGRIETWGVLPLITGLTVYGVATAFGLTTT